MRGKWRYRNWNIGAKIMVGYILLAIIVTLFAGLFSYDLGTRNLQEVALRELVRHAEGIAARHPQQNDVLTIPSWEDMEFYQRMADAMVYFVDTDYVAVHAPASEEPSAEAAQHYRIYTRVFNAMDQQFIARVLLGETVTEVRWFAFAQTKGLFAGIPLVNTSGHVVGGLILVQSLGQGTTMWNTLGKVLVQGGGAALLVAAVLAWLFSGSLSKTVRQITQVARRILDGDYRVRVQVSGTDEIGELAGTINTLSARLGDTIENLRGERDQLDTIIGGIGEGIIAMDSGGRIVRFNRAFLGLMEIGGEEDIVSGSSLEMTALLDKLNGSMYSRRPCTEKWTGPSGRNILAEISPLFGKKREIVGSVALLQDVSEAERLEQLRRDYIANISHELRTPLTGIRGMVEPLMDGYIDTEEEKADCYQVIYRETIRLEKLIGEMLDVSRLQAGRVQLETEPLEVNGILEASLRRVRSTAAEAGVELKTDLPDEALACIGNEDRILQVLTIFLDNALSFTPEGGNITVYARDEADRVRLGVIDTGVGIEPKDLPFIWERFFKSDRSRMRTSGTGLGLAIAKLVVELMDGEVGVASEYGKGSEFYFSLKKK